MPETPPFNPLEILEANEDSDEATTGYRSSQFAWFGPSVPEQMSAKCLMCDYQFSTMREALLKKGSMVAFNDCPSCRRKSLKIFDAQRWEAYVNLRLGEFEFFTDQFGDAFAVRTRKDGVRQIFPIRSEEMRHHLALLLKNRGQIDNAVLYLEALAQRWNITHRLETRIAKKDGAIWVDLCDDSWGAIRVDKNSWQFVASPPILFRRYKHMQAMTVLPGARADLDAFMGIMNFADEGEKLLYAGYAAALFIPDIDHPILMPVGPQGSAKTTLTAATRLLADPSELTTLNISADEGALPQIIMHHYVPAFDNCGYISQEISDVLCRVVSGAGFSKRKLYSDNDDVVYTIRRPLVMNGISPPSMSPDLIDRTILIRLERIADAFRRKKQDVEAERDALLPKVRGYLLSCIAQVLRTGPTPPNGAGLPRLADFAEVADACSVAMGKQPYEFLNAYIESTHEMAEQAVQSDPLATTLLDFLNEQGEWAGTANELWQALNGRPGAATRAPNWPKDHSRMAESIHGRLKPGLAELGWSVVKQKSNGSRTLRFVKMSGELRTSS